LASNDAHVGYADLVNIIAEKRNCFSAYRRVAAAKPSHGNRRRRRVL